jgi:predicted DNA-binding transcriptional regulator
MKIDSNIDFIRYARYVAIGILGIGMGVVIYTLLSSANNLIVIDPHHVMGLWISLIPMGLLLYFLIMYSPSQTKEEHNEELFSELRELKRKFKEAQQSHPVSQTKKSVQQ